MKKLVILFAGCLLITSVATAQTRRIMHRSHSGKDASAAMDRPEDNFGLSSAQMRAMDSTRNQQAKDSVKPQPVKATRKTTHKKTVKKRSTPAKK